MTCVSTALVTFARTVAAAERLAAAVVAARPPLGTAVPAALVLTRAAPVTPGRAVRPAGAGTIAPASRPAGPIIR